MEPAKHSGPHLPFDFFISLKTPPILSHELDKHLWVVIFTVKSETFARF